MVRSEGCYDPRMTMDAPISEPILELMRAGNPEIWKQIDEFTAAGVDLDDYLSDLPCPRGTCRDCGYNLSGNLTGTCPECGASFQPSASCEILQRLRVQNSQVWKQIRDKEERRRRALKEQADREIARQRQQRRERALQSYMQWVHERGS